MKLARLSLLLVGFLASGTVSHAEPPAAKPQPNPNSAPKSAATGWRPLFNGRTLDGWKSTNFGGEGEVGVKDGAIVLPIGSPMTGVTYQGPLPKLNYEVRCEAMRADGNDFFCGMTFPVADSHCSLIVGGWGGAIVGLSSINGHDASENETTKFMNFENKRWYKFRVRVEPHRIQAWIDEDRVIDVDIVGCKISTRVEVDLSKPFGFASFDTKALLRKIEVRELAAAERQPPAESK